MWYPYAENAIFGTFVHEQVAALKGFGIDVRVVQPTPLTPFPISRINDRYKKLASIPPKEVYKGVTVYHPRYVTLPRRLFYEHVGNWMYKGILNTVLSVYGQWPFDVIHAHATYPCGWSANLIRDNHLKHIRTLHTIHRVSIIDTPKKNKSCFARVQESLSRADWNVFVSMEGYRLAMSYTQDRIREKSSYITNGVNASQFSLAEEDHAEVRKLKKTYENTLNILFIGYLMERKGIKELLRAYEMLKDYGANNTRLFLVGRDLSGSYVDAFIKSHGLQGRVIPIGTVLHDHIKRWLEFADIFVLPSHSEGLPTVLFEALYMRKPAIFTTVGGISDVIENMEQAILIEPKSAAAIAKALSMLINDPGLRERLGHNGHRLIRDHYTWEINAKQNIEIYQKMIKQA